MLEKLNENNRKIKEFLLIVDRKYNSVIIPCEKLNLDNLDKKTRIYGPVLINSYKIYLGETEKITPSLKVYDIGEEYPDIKRAALGAYISAREFTQFF